MLSIPLSGNIALGKTSLLAAKRTIYRCGNRWANHYDFPQGWKIRGRSSSDIAGQEDAARVSRLGAIVIGRALYIRPIMQIEIYHCSEFLH
jgi:hypothetical protein